MTKGRHLKEWVSIESKSLFKLLLVKPKQDLYKEDSTKEANTMALEFLRKRFELE